MMSLIIDFPAVFLIHICYPRRPGAHSGKEKLTGVQCLHKESFRAHNHFHLHTMRNLSRRLLDVIIQMVGQCVLTLIVVQSKMLCLSELAKG